MPPKTLPTREILLFIQMLNPGINTSGTKTRTNGSLVKINDTPSRMILTFTPMPMDLNTSGIKRKAPGSLK